MDEKKVCHECGCIIEDDNWTEIDGEIYCDDCRDDLFLYCDCCGEYKPQGEVIEVDGEYVCEECRDYYSRYYFCDCCEEWHDSRVSVRSITAEGETICEGCYEDYYDTCSDCDNIFRRDDMRWDEYEDEYVCEQCYDERARHKVIKDYSYKPDPRFKTIHDVFYNGMRTSEMMFGVELEIDDGNDGPGCAEEIIGQSDDIYCKHDGSLGDDGVEIVTHPCSLEYHLKELGWENICEIAKSWGYRSHDAGTCGLHVHVGRYQLGKDEEERRQTVAKIVIFVEKHYKELAKFARRKEYQLSDWAKKPDFDYSYDINQTMYNALACRRNGRYQALNQTNSETIEFRIFNGSLIPDTIKATLELVNNICQYCKDTDPEKVLTAGWDEVVQYKEFPELNQYLQKRKLLGKDMELSLEEPTYEIGMTVWDRRHNCECEIFAIDDGIFHVKYSRTHYWTHLCNDSKNGVTNYVHAYWLTKHEIEPMSRRADKAA